MEINVFNSGKKDYSCFCYKRFAKKEKAGAQWDGVVETGHKSTGHTCSMLCYRSPASTRGKENKLPKPTSGLYIGVEYKWARFFFLKYKFGKGYS